LNPARAIAEIKKMLATAWSIAA